MKKLILPILSAALFIPAAARAQSDTSIGLRLPTQKGSVMLGSNLVLAETAFGSTSGEFNLTGSYNVSIHPRAAYFISDNLAIGGMLGVNFAGSTFSRLDYHSQSIGAGVFVRKYFGKAANKDGSVRSMRFFVEAGATGNTGWSQFDVSPDVTQKGTFSGATFHFMPGFNYFLNKHVALEGGLNYSHTAVTGRTVGHSDRLGINLGFQFFIGRK